MQISNFLQFGRKINRWELKLFFPWISSPKGMFWRNKRSIDFPWLSSDSPHSQKITLKTNSQFLFNLTINSEVSFFHPFTTFLLELQVLLQLPLSDFHFGLNLLPLQRCSFIIFSFDICVGTEVYNYSTYVKYSKERFKFYEFFFLVQIAVV